MKGVSPLIASVLLIVATIGVSIALLPQVMKQAQEPLTESKSQSVTAVDCANAHFTIVSVANENGMLAVSLQNTGQKELGSFFLYVNTLKGLKAVEHSVEGSLLPGSVFRIVNTTFPYSFSDKIIVSSQECSAAKSESTMTDKSLVGYWMFDESLQDASGKNNHGSANVSGRNQVKNPSFESGASGWNSWQTGHSGTPNVVSVSDSPYGLSSSHFLRTTFGGSMYVQDVPVVGNKTYTLSAYGKGTNIIQGSQGWHRLVIIGVYLDANGTDLGHVDLYFDPGTTNWTRKTATAVAPSTAVKYQLRVGMDNATGEGWIDGIQVEQQPAATLFSDTIWQAGVSGQGIEFDGIDDYVVVTHSSSLSPTTEITVSAWIKQANGTHSTLVRKDRSYLLEPQQPNISSELYLRAPTFVIINSTFGEGSRVISTSIPSFGSWHHWAGTHNASRATVYVNGTVDSTNTSFGSIGTSVYPLYIGGWLSGITNTTEYFTGVVDEVRIYNRALKEYEVKALYEAYAP